jgi:hypothetical protein
MYQKWLKMQSDIGPLNNSFFLFISTLFSQNETEALQDIERAISGEIDWIKSNFERFPNFQEQMAEFLRNPDEYKESCKQLIGLRKLLPFAPREINNIPENSVFWECIDNLKNDADANRQVIGNEIEGAIATAKTIEDRLEIVLSWLNLFGYYPDNLTRKEKIRSYFSDTLHGTYCIACDAILTLDRRFAKRIAAAIAALKLRTEVGTDANELLRRIANKSGSR